MKTISIMPFGDLVFPTDTNSDINSIGNLDIQFPQPISGSGISNTLGNLLSAIGVTPSTNIFDEITPIFNQIAPTPTENITYEPIKIKSEAPLSVQDIKSMIIKGVDNPIMTVLPAPLEVPTPTTTPTIPNTNVVVTKTEPTKNNIIKPVIAITTIALLYKAFSGSSKKHVKVKG